MATIHPHINFNGNAEEAFSFYQSIFGGEISQIVRFKDIGNDEFPVSPEEENLVMHIALSIGGTFLMGNDVPSFLGKVNERENRSKIYIAAISLEEAESLFNGLSEGGEVEFPLTESPLGSSFAMFRDRYGIEWMIEFSTLEKDN